MGNTHPQNFFKEFLQNSYSQKFRPVKYKHYTVFLRQLQGAIATLDSSIAELELQSTSQQRLVALRRERSRMMTELNRKVETRLRTVRRNSDDVFTRLATDYENFTRDQVQWMSLFLTLSLSLSLPLRCVEQ